MDLPKRKHTRIPGYDYSTCHYYFITTCTDKRKCLFGNPGALNTLGQIAKKCIELVSEKYPQAVVDKYVVMPNHIHMILVLDNYKKEKKVTVTQIIGQYKMAVTKSIHAIDKDKSVWQRSFHDHIIRTTKEYDKIWLYIENNPAKWEEDCFYEKQP